VAADVPTTFFSYCREDLEFALRLAKDLKKAGANVWMDKLDIRPGQLWEQKAEEALENCGRLLVILSPASVSSRNVMAEVAFALDEQKEVIPVLYRDCKIPFRLRPLHYVDFRTDYSQGLGELLTTVAKEQPQVSAPPPELLLTKECSAVLADYEQGKVWALRGVSTLIGHTTFVMAVALTPDGRRAVSASDDNTLKVWDVASGRELRTLTGHEGPVWAVAVTPDGKRAVSGSNDRTLKVWELDNGRELRTLTGHLRRVNAVAVTPDGQRVVSASGDGTLKLWNLGNGEELRILTGHANWVRAVAVTPDGQHAVSASGDRTLKVWDLDGGRELRTLNGHSREVYGVAMTVDGQLAISASYDKTLKVWELASGRELATFEVGASLDCCAVSSDGKTILAGDANGLIHVLRLESA
jgi:WD40 repeat protein